MEVIATGACHALHDHFTQDFVGELVGKFGILATKMIGTRYSRTAVGKSSRVRSSPISTTVSPTPSRAKAYCHARVTLLIIF